jgi:GT2 family glycosyltransferase/SAM-dependent methyltransferase
MKDTGERFIPGLGDARITYEHLLRYLLAKEAVRDKEVLDLGSGEGYGAFLLAHEARQVVGLDIALEAVAHASSKYAAANLSFLVASALAVPFKQGTFDAITCFEVIEHITDAARLLAEIKRVLRPGGIVLISTPNKKTYSDDAKYANPFHVKEFYLDEIRELLERSFTHVAFYGERLAFGASLWNLSPSAELSRIGELVAEVVPGEPAPVREAQQARQEPLYFVAVCSDRPIPEGLLYRSLFLNDQTRLIQVEFEATRARWEQEIGALRQAMGRARADVDAIVAGLQGQVAEDQGVAERLRAQILELRDQLAEKERAVAALQAEAVRKAEESELLKARLQAHERSGHILRKDLAERAQAIDALHARLDERERALQAEISHVSHQLETILSSTAWRVTEPLRRVSLKAQLWNPLHILRRAWRQLAYDRRPLRSLTPIVETNLPNPREATYWIPGLQVAHQALESLFMHPTTRVTHRLHLPPRATFRAYATLLPEAWGRNPSGVEFAVTVTPGGGGHVRTRNWLIHPTGFPRHRRWVELTLSLEQFANQDVEFVLSTAIPPGGSPASAWAAWGDPAILSRRSAREIWSRAVRSVRLNGLTGALARAAAPIELHESPASPVPDQQPAPSTTTSMIADQAVLEARLQQFLSQPSVRLIFPHFEEPLVSIVIPTFNKAEYLYQCLESILIHTDVPYELIVVDDHSRDATRELLEKCEALRVERNAQNLEYVRSCNIGVALAHGRYIMFLNNDVVVTPRWLSLLVDTIERSPECGAVGAKLIRPNGSLQEAGSIVWADGTALGYGRDDDPFKPEYSYLREVDYCSAACLLVRAELVRKRGGFDERYRPAYYEDADLCFGVRRLGYRVLLQPVVTVFHHEFGSRSFEGARLLIETNHSTFVEKWGENLRKQVPYGDVLRARDRRPGRRVLVMDDQIPAPHLGLGLPRTRRLLQFLSELGCVVTFVPLVDATAHQPITAELQQMGIEVFSGNFSPEGLLRSRSAYYEVVIISRPHNAARVMSLARQQFPNAAIIYDAEAIFCVREFLKAQLEGHRLPEADKQRMLKEELSLMAGADVVTTVSQVDRDIILKERAHNHVMVWEHAPDLAPSSLPCSQRKDLLFVGTVTEAHPPNIDAVLHFAANILPRIRERLPNCRFIIVGSDPAERVRRLASESVVVTGFVGDLREYYEKCRVFVVPSRFGAGISLKLIEAMGQGIPAVVSAFGASGLELHNGREVLIAKSDEEFADRVVELYENEALWNNVQQASQDFARQHWSPDVMRKKLADILDQKEELLARRGV